MSIPYFIPAFWFKNYSGNDQEKVLGEKRLSKLPGIMLPAIKGNYLEKSSKKEGY